jgi:hypothetical protein
VNCLCLGQYPRAQGYKERRVMSMPSFVCLSGIIVIAGFVYLLRKIVWGKYAYAAGIILFVAFLCWFRANY